MPRKLLLLAAVLSVAAILAWLALRERAMPSPVVAAPERGAVEAPPAEIGVSDLQGEPAPARVEATAADAAAAAPATPANPAPPIPADLPLRDIIADLERRARAGEAHAACRLGAELLRCERARNMQPWVDNIEAQARNHTRPGAKPEELDRSIDMALRRQAENTATLEHCEGVDAAAWAPPARWFAIAAQAGHRPSMVRFLGAELFRSDQLFRDPELIPLFRANAPRYFSTLLEAGDVEFLQRWAMSSAMPNDILTDVLPPPYNERGLGTAMMDQYLRARGIKPPEVMRPFPPTPEQVALAEQLFARHFGAAPLNDDSTRQRMAASLYDLSQFRCDEAGG